MITPLSGGEGGVIIVWQTEQRSLLLLTFVALDRQCLAGLLYVWDLQPLITSPTYFHPKQT